LTGFESVFPPSSDVETHTAFGTLPLPFSVTKER